MFFAYVNPGSSAVLVDGAFVFTKTAGTFYVSKTPLVEGSWVNENGNLGTKTVQKIKQSPSGDLYALTDAGIYKVSASTIDSSVSTGGNASTTNKAPTANAGADQVVSSGTTVTLDSSSSSDSDGSIKTRTWMQVSGTSVTLSSKGVISPSFTAPTVSTSESLVFSVTVVDDQGSSSSDTVTIKVDPATGGSSSESSSSTSSSTSSTGVIDYLLLFLMLVISLIGRNNVCIVSRYKRLL